MDSYQQADPSRHEYGVPGSQFGISLFLGVLFIAAIIPIGYLAATESSRNSSATILIFGLVLLAAGAYLLAWAVRSRVVIQGSQLSVRRIFDESTWNLSEIEGFRTYTYKRRSYWVISLKDGRPPVRLPHFAIDDAFRAWFSQLTDLDQRDRTALLDQISSDEKLGSTPEERLGALAIAKAWSIGLAVVTGAAMAGLILGAPDLQLPSAVVLTLAPLAVMLLLHRSPLLYSLMKRKADPRGDLTATLALSGTGLVLWLDKVNLVSWQILCLCAIPVLLVYLAALYHPAQSSGSPRALFALSPFPSSTASEPWSARTPSPTIPAARSTRSAS